MKARSFCRAAALSALMTATAAWPAPPVLAWPLACTPNTDCWIANHVDLDPGPGVRDYACGVMTYDGHNGTDIAVRDRAEMDKGVAVLAAAAGRVMRTRDGVVDVSVRDIGKEAVKDLECGNGALVDHGEGWETQYCHLRRGSVRVKVADVVAAGQPLGMVGLSGLTEYPHLHITVRHRGKIIDPFRGAEDGANCTAAKSLWRPDIGASIPYAPGIVYNAGFAPEVPSTEGVRSGRYRKLGAMGADAEVLAFYAQAFGVGPGDRMELRVTDPDGNTLVVHRVPVERWQARRTDSVAKRRPASSWPGGVYRGEARLVRADGGRSVGSVRTAEIEIEPRPK